MGGIAGAAEDAITIYKSVNHGNITINRNAKYYGAGGILGYVKQGEHMSVTAVTGQI